MSSDRGGAGRDSTVHPTGTASGARGAGGRAAGLSRRGPVSDWPRAWGRVPTEFSVGGCCSAVGLELSSVGGLLHLTGLSPFVPQTTFSCPRTSTWTAWTWTRRSGKWSTSKGQRWVGAVSEVQRSRVPADRALWWLGRWLGRQLCSQPDSRPHTARPRLPALALLAPPLPSAREDWWAAAVLSVVLAPGHGVGARRLPDLLGQSLGTAPDLLSGPRAPGCAGVRDTAPSEGEECRVQQRSVPCVEGAKNVI